MGETKKQFNATQPWIDLASGLNATCSLPVKKWVLTHSMRWGNVNHIKLWDALCMITIFGSLINVHNQNNFWRVVSPISYQKKLKSGSLSAT